MKKLNILITVLCIILVVVNLIIDGDLNEAKSAPNYGSANSGIGVAFVLMVTWIVNLSLLILFFISTVIVGIIKKKLKNSHTLLNIVLIIIIFVFLFRAFFFY